ncbi:MAG TPA: type II toxin-antitoxin system HicB family antitoxin [Polyangiaceae bacterium]
MQRSTKRTKSKKPSSPSVERPSPNDYQMVLEWSDDDRCYIVTIPAWQNARTHGATLEEAARNARDVVALLIDSARRHGEPIPPPSQRHSGNLRLRLPSSLHGRLTLEAEREGVSLNQWIVAKLAS